MTDENLKETPEILPVQFKPTKLVEAELTYMDYNTGNPWNPDDIDKMDSLDEKDYKKVIDACRFFYKHDALSSTVLNKMVDIGITPLVFNKNGLTDNEFKVFTAYERKLRAFAEDMALEFLLSGLVVPEVTFAAVTKDYIKSLGIKKYESLMLPVSMWLRDPATIIINKNLISSDPSYFVEVPNDVVYFIIHEGHYSDGTVDIVAYEELKARYPEFVMMVKEGVRKIPLENDHIIRRRVISDTAYPIPYLYSAIEPLKHKRNLRRMDYSIAARVISAIMQVRLGSDEFPITEEDTDQFDSIKQQMMYRNSNNKDVERIFQLFTNHTVAIEWIFPPVDALLNENKYKDVNQDIIFALGFPKILITGETDRSNSSEAQYAAQSPVKTMNNFREKIIEVISYVVYEIAKQNNFKAAPEVYFSPLQLAEYKTFMEGLVKLYETGNLSREAFSDYFGYNFIDELEKRKNEQRMIEEAKVPEFALTPNARNPDISTQPNQQKPTEKPKTEQNKPK